VVHAHLQAQATRNDPAKRGQRKIELVKGLYRHNWTADDGRKLFRLIDWMMALPEEFENQFWIDFEAFDEESNMQYITSIERIGMRKGLHEGVALSLDIKFGRDGLKLLRKTREFNLDELRKFARFLKKAKTIDDVRGYFE
jgi:hypothetical protein